MSKSNPLRSEEYVRKLIEEVKKRECLWNKEHERYNDRFQISKAWMEIEEIMHLPEERLRSKWKNLRDLFKKEIKRFGSVNQYQGKWYYFDDLKFIEKSNDENSVAKDELEDDDVEFSFTVEEDPERNNEVQVYLNESYAEDPIPEKRAKTSNTDDEYDLMFLKSLTPYFKQLDPIRKLVVRSKMQDMLLNEIAAQASANQLQIRKS